MERVPRTNIIVTLVVIAQFACTSLWFAGNAILPDLQTEFALSENAISNLTSTVQFGFIFGTLIFALLSISDRYSPSKVFFVCALFGAAANFLITLISSATHLFLLRGLVGFFLAGIYPVGMKITADYYEKGLGKVLGLLVGALVVGTALPHLLRVYNGSMDWHFVIYTTSSLAIVGGTLIFFFVPNGPFRKRGSKLDLSLCFAVFKNKKFRGAAFGYFGHMWELYTMWAFTPFIINYYNQLNNQTINVALWSFVIIAIGGTACAIGGYYSKLMGSSRIAFIALLVSCICCLVSFATFQLPVIFFVSFLMVWGMSVVTDSPQFSTLVAQFAPAEARGTALTIVNSIGFAITIVSLKLMDELISLFDPKIVFIVLSIGPLLGLMALSRAKIIE
ncbi:MAG TPA: MFS transporter [Cyclobacteriaceae bacterium]